MKVLLTGATGYIGKRLLPVLIDKGYTIICCVRDKNKFHIEDDLREKVQVIEVDLTQKETLNTIPKEIDFAYYLVHSMSASKNFSELEKQSAINFRDALNITNVKQVIYLSGIVNSETLSKQLNSRKNVEIELGKGNYSLTTLRAGIIIGSGSASFEIIRDLVEKLPIMIAPKWLKTKCQPIGISDVIEILIGTLGDARTYNNMNLNFREGLFRIWYWYVNKADKNAEVLFMNFGYSDNQHRIELDEQSEPNRYPMQLYHHLTNEVVIKNKDIIEIGCGRGGGLHYIARNFSPSSAKGIDINKQAVSFCNRFYNLKGLTFAQGDAQKLSLADNSCDVIINVESSHRYPRMSEFLKEVSRILRPDGHFLFTDFRYDFEMDEMKKLLETSGMTIIKERLINQEVIAALELDDIRKRKLIKKLAPRFIHKIALNFAGVIDSVTYKQFVSKKYVYYSYVLKKI